MGREVERREDRVVGGQRADDEDPRDLRRGAHRDDRDPDPQLGGPPQRGDPPPSGEREQDRDDESDPEQRVLAGESIRTTVAIPTRRTRRRSGAAPAPTSSTSTAPEAQTRARPRSRGRSGSPTASRNRTIGVSAPRKPRSRSRDAGPRRRLATAEVSSAAIRATVARRMA